MTYRDEFLTMIRSRSAAGTTFFRPIVMQYAAHEVNHSYKDFYLDHKVLVEGNLACRERYGMDAVGSLSDPYRESSAYGLQLKYPEEGVPIPQGHLIINLEDLQNLREPDIEREERTRDRIEAIKLYQKILDDDTPIIGWVEGPLAEACTLAGVENMLIKLAIEPEFCHLILRKMVPTAKKFALAQIKAGAKIIGMGDAICSQISKRMYAEFVKPLQAEIIQFIQAHDCLVKLHICGNITHLLPDIAEIKPDIVDIDWQVDLDQAYEVLGPDIIRCGNLDPAGLIERKSAEEVFQAARNLVENERGRAFILSGGCEITPLTPKENFLALKRATQKTD